MPISPKSRYCFIYLTQFFSHCNVTLNLRLVFHFYLLLSIITFSYPLQKRIQDTRKYLRWRALQ